MGEVTDPALLSQLNASGDQALSQIRSAKGDGYANLIQAIAEGRHPAPTGAAARSPANQQLLNDVFQYDPSADAANLPARSAARKAFTSGKQGQNITSFNTAIGHLGTLAQNAEALGNTDYPIWNGIGNFVDTQTGDPRVTNFNTAKQAVVDELERAFKGTGGNVHEIKQWEDTLNSSRSPAQLRGAIQQAAQLLRSRIGAQQDSYNAAMGTTDQPLPMLNQHASDALSKFDSKDYLDKGYGALASPSITPGGPGDSGPGAPPAPNGSNPPAPPTGGAPTTPWEQPSAPQIALPTGTTHDVFDAKQSSAIDQMVRSGTPFDQAQAYAKQNGFALDPATYAATLAYAAKNPHYKGSYGNISHAVQNSPLTQAAVDHPTLVGAPVAAGVGLADAGTFGTANKVVAGVDALGSRLGGDNRSLGDIYDQNLTDNNAKRDLIEGAHPVAALGGQVAGFLGGDAVLGAGLKAAGRAIPGAAALGGRLIPAGARAAAQDAAYGAAYGAGSSDTLADAGKNALAGAALGAGGGMLGRGVARGTAAALTGVTDAGVRRLTDAGVALTPGQILGATGTKVGNAVKGIEDRLTGFPIIGSAINDARRAGVEDFNRAAINDALAPIGKEANGIGHAGVADMQAKASDAIDQALAPISAAPDPQLHTDIQVARSDASLLSTDHQKQFANTLDRDVEPYLRGQGPIAGSDIKAIKEGLDKKISNLRSGNSSPQDRDLADAFEGVKDSFLDFAGRVDPSAASDYANARQAYALSKRVSAAAAASKDGTFTPNQFRTAVTKRGFGTTTDRLARGEAPFQRLSTDASTILPSAVPDSGTAGRLALGAALGGASGYGHDGAGGALAGAALGAAAFSRPGLRATQAILAGSRGRAVTTLGDVIRANANLGGAVGTPLLLQKLSK